MPPLTAIPPIDLMSPASANESFQRGVALRGRPIAWRLGHPMRSIISADRRNPVFNEFNQENLLEDSTLDDRKLTVHQPGVLPISAISISQRERTLMDVSLVIALKIFLIQHVQF